MKFMNKKRLASAALAGVMAMSMAVPAFAEDQSTVITAAYADIELSVTVPANTNAQINPYGLPVTMGDSVTTISGQPITIATPLMIQNQSSVALKVGANVKAEANGVTLVNAANSVTESAGAKEAFVELQLFEAAGIDGTGALDPTMTCPAYAALEDDDAVLTAVLDSSATNGVDTSGTLVLREGADGLAQSGGVAFVRLSGVVSKKPSTAWATTDTLKATITYSFEPNTYTKSAGTIAAQRPLSMATGGDTTATLNLTSALPSGVTATSTTWESSDEAVVTVAETSGTVVATAHAAGNADVTVTIVGSDGITYTATIALTVAAAS